MWWLVPFDPETFGVEVVAIDTDVHVFEAGVLIVEGYALKVELEQSEA